MDIENYLEKEYNRILAEQIEENAYFITVITNTHKSCSTNYIETLKIVTYFITRIGVT